MTINVSCQKTCGASYHAVESVTGRIIQHGTPTIRGTSHSHNVGWILPSACSGCVMIQDCDQQVNQLDLMTLCTSRTETVHNRHRSRSVYVASRCDFVGPQTRCNKYSRYMHTQHEPNDKPNHRGTVTSPLK